MENDRPEEFEPPVKRSAWENLEDSSGSKTEVGESTDSEVDRDEASNSEVDAKDFQNIDSRGFVYRTDWANKMLDHWAMDRRCNAFGPPRIRDNPDDNLIAERMLRFASQPHHLRERAEEERWAKKKASWLPIPQELLPDFPKLTIHELRYITLGVYQLKQPKSYTEEH